MGSAGISSYEAASATASEAEDWAVVALLPLPSTDTPPVVSVGALVDVTGAGGGAATTHISRSPNCVRLAAKPGSTTTVATL